MNPAMTQAIFQSVQVRPVIAAGSAWGTSSACLTSGTLPGYVQVAWQTGEQHDQLVLAYVDGRFAGMTHQTDQRELWLQMDPSISHEVQLWAISAEQAAGLIPPMTSGSSAMATLTIRRDETWPVQTQLRWSVNDQQQPTLPLWSQLQPRSGFGGLFGQGGFGFDDAAGFGLGRGELAEGPLGSDSTNWRFHAGHWSSQNHQVQLQAIDASGQPISRLVSIDRTVQRPIDTPGTLACDPDFTLHWNN